MIPPSRAAAQSIAYARAVLDRAMHTIWPAEGFEVIAKAADDLREAVEIHDLLAADRLSWESYDADLRRMREPQAAAVDDSAEAAAEHADWLAEVVEKHLGRAAAEYVSGGEAQAAA